MFLDNIEVIDQQVPYIDFAKSCHSTINIRNGFFYKLKLPCTLILLPTNCRIFKDKVLPSDNVLSGSCEEEKQLLKMLGVEYISYHACLNDCILYRREYADKEICLKCGHDRYHKSNKNGKLHGPPHKILRHIPIIPRI
jgi:hypothetical protein